MKFVDSKRKLLPSTRVFAQAAVFLCEAGEISPFSPQIGRFSPDSPFSRRTSPVCTCKMPASQHQIRQPEQREELRFVLRQSLVTHLAVAEQVLHHMERMLHLRAHAGLGLFQCLESHAIGVHQKPFTARDFLLRRELGIRETDLLHEGEHRAAA